MPAELWSDADIALARSLWDEGMSTTEIGRRLGRSKNSVCGLRTRRGWPPRPSIIALTPAQILARTAKIRLKLMAMHDADGAEALGHARKARKPVIEAPPPPEPPPPPVPVYLRCRYPLSDGRPWLFCDAAVAMGGPYCRMHREVCYLKPGTRAWMLEQAA